VAKFETVEIVDLVAEHTGSIGLAFVPDVVAGAVDIRAAHRALLAAANAGLIELRADSGLGRYTKAELESSPPGPDGSRLLWARLI